MVNDCKFPVDFGIKWSIILDEFVFFYEWRGLLEDVGEAKISGL